jgi:hypothetical protein
MPRGRQRRAVPDRRVTFRCEPEHHEFLKTLGGKDGVSKAIRMLIEDRQAKTPPQATEVEPNANQ